jgi:hypothetical protein
MFYARSDMSSRYSSSTTQSQRNLRKDVSFVSPGIMDNAIMLSSKPRADGDGTVDAGTNVDTMQQKITATVLNCGPPTCSDPDAVYSVDSRKSDLYAPPSKHPMANYPQRHELAFTCPNATEWAAANGAVPGGTFAYANAIAIFTNMAGIPKTMRLKFVGVCTNTGADKRGSDGRGNDGAVVQYGGMTTANSGPRRIPANTLFYGVPEAMVCHDNSVKEGDKSFMPAYQDTSERAAGIDKYRASTHEVVDSDVIASFQHIRNETDEFIAREGANMQRLTNDKVQKHIQSITGALSTTPAFKYSEVNTWMSRYLFLWGKMIDTAGPAPPLMVKGVEDAFDDCVAAITQFWKQFTREQEEINKALPEPARDNVMNATTWYSSRKSGEWVKNKTDDDKLRNLVRQHTYLMKDCSAIYEMAFGAQVSYQRSFICGKTRYSAIAMNHMDAVFGYHL